MANITRALTVPTDLTPGTGVDCSALEAGARSFIFVGADDDKVRIDASNDGTHWAPLFERVGAGWCETIECAALYHRAQPLEGCAAATLHVSGASASLTAGPAGAPSMGNLTVTGSASTTNATATQLFTYTPATNGVISIMGQLVGVKDDGTVYSTGVTFLWKRVSGTLTAIGATLWGENTTSLNPGDATATVSTGVAVANVVGIAATNIAWTFNGAALIA